MSKRCLPLFFLLFPAGCQKKAVGPPPRYAVVRFENLSGDPSFDWMGRAASEILPAMLSGTMDGPVLNADAIWRLAPTLGGRPPAAPGISTERTAAILAGATRLICGYMEREPRGVRITAVVEDLSNGKIARTISADTLAQLAHMLVTNAAVRFYAIGLESPPDAALKDFEQALHINPDFGPAWLALTRLDIAKRDRAGAEETIAEARRRKLDPLTAANLDAEEASVNGDQSAGIAAIKKISALSPGDTHLLRSLAETQLTAGHFADSASDWKRLADLLPNDVAVWNYLGYARSYAGDFSGAMAAFQKYMRLAPADPNPFDSIGDLDYSYRKFSDAAAKYLEAYAKNPNFQQGGDLYKAAWAKFNAGDKAGADELFARFRNIRAKSSDSLVPLVAADWLYRTGRTEEAVTGLGQWVNDAKFSQLAIWDLLAGDRAKAAADARLTTGAANAVSMIVRFATLPSATPAEWKARAEQMFPAPAMSSPRHLVLGYALLLDGKREAALPVWEEIARNAPATDFFMQAIYARLQGKPLQHPLVPDPNSVNQLAALLDKL